MKVLISDKMSPKGLEVFKQFPEIEVDVKVGMSPEELAAAGGLTGKRVPWIAGGVEITIGGVAGEVEVAGGIDCGGVDCGGGFTGGCAPTGTVSTGTVVTVE
jgi:hypothetical protein